MMSAPKPELICQACGGSGSHFEQVLSTGEGYRHDCAWCKGTGKVTPEVRGIWLRDQPRKTKPPKPELTAELRAVIDNNLPEPYRNWEEVTALVREVVEIVAREDSTRAANWLGNNYQLSEAILKDWGLK